MTTTLSGIGHCGEVVEVNAKLAHETLIPLGKAQEATAALDSTAPPGMEHHRENETVTAEWALMLHPQAKSGGSISGT